MKQAGQRKRLVEQALLKVGSRYQVCSLVAKRTNQLIRHPESEGVAWAIDQALRELLDDRIQYQLPAADEAKSISAVQ